MKNYISQFIEQIDKIDSRPLIPLPLIHTTSGFYFRQIIDEGMTLNPKPCPIFRDESLLYFFYGKASYIQQQPFYSSLSPYFPVSLILDPLRIVNVKRIYPFDSGAFVNNVFTNYIPKNLDLGSFLIDEPNQDLKSAAKLVKAFYHSNENYFQNMPRADLNITALNFEVESFVNMIQSKENTPFDERSSSIEIQIDSPLNLKEVALAIILPINFKEDPKIKSLIKQMPLTEFIGYSTLRGNPSYFASLIIDRIGEFLNRKKYLHLNNV